MVYIHLFLFVQFLKLFELFQMSLDPPIKQGQTRYHFLVLLFNQEEESSIELPFSE